MSTFIERFKHRSVASSELSLKLGDAIFIVKPFSQVELDEGRRRAIADAIKSGIPSAQITGNLLYELVGVGYADVIKRHVQKVTLRSDEGVQDLSVPEIEILFAEMDFTEKYALSNAYIDALEDDRKKKAQTSPLSSSNSSSAASATN